MLSFNSTGHDNNLGQNIYYNKGTITVAKDVTDKEEGQMFGKKDLAIYIEIMVDGLEFPKKVTLAGDFKRDTNDAIIGWGGAFVIEKLFNAVDVKGKLTGSHKVPNSVLKEVVGKEVAFITYKNKTGKFSTWRHMFHVNAQKTHLRDNFLKDRARLDKGGWTNNWDSGDSLPSSAPSTTQEPWQQTQQQPVANGSSNELDFLDS